MTGTIVWESGMPFYRCEGAARPLATAELGRSDVSEGKEAQLQSNIEWEAVGPCSWVCRTNQGMEVLEWGS